jgi:hypothetical protein
MWPNSTQSTVNNSILWKAFKKLPFTLHRLLSKTFWIPSSFLSVSNESACIRQTMATISGKKAIQVQVWGTRGIYKREELGRRPLRPPPRLTVGGETRELYTVYTYEHVYMLTNATMERKGNIWDSVGQTQSSWNQDENNATENAYHRFEVLTPAKISIVVVWFVTSCILVSGYESIASIFSVEVSED